jgi:hypothetical protein
MLPPEDALGLREGDGGGFEGRLRGIGEMEFGGKVGFAGRGSAAGGLLSCSSAFLLGAFENGRRHRKGSLEAGTSSGINARGNCASKRPDASLLMPVPMFEPTRRI